MVMNTPSLKISKFSAECLASLNEELPFDQWDTQSRCRLDMALELVSYEIEVYLIEWEGETRLEKILPGNRIGNETVGVVEGYQIWSVGAHNFATASRLISFIDKRSHPWTLRQKELVY